MMDSFMRALAFIVISAGTMVIVFLTDAPPYIAIIAVMIQFLYVQMIEIERDADNG